MTNLKIFLFILLASISSNFKLNGQTYPDSIKKIQIANQILIDTIAKTDKSLTELEKELEQRKKEFQKKYSREKKIRRAHETIKTDSILNDSINFISQKIKLDREARDSIKILKNELSNFEVFNTEYNSLLTQLEDLEKTLGEFNNDYAAKEKKLDSLNGVYNSISIAKNELFCIPNKYENEPIEKQIMKYLNDEPYCYEKNNSLLEKISKGNKYHEILGNYCNVSRNAHLKMGAIIALGTRTSAKRMYDSRYKDDVSKWKTDYPWVYNQFLIKESELNRKMNKEKNPIPNPKCDEKMK